MRIILTSITDSCQNHSSYSLFFSPFYLRFFRRCHCYKKNFFFTNSNSVKFLQVIRILIKKPVGSKKPVGKKRFFFGKKNGKKKKITIIFRKISEKNEKKPVFSEKKNG